MLPYKYTNNLRTQMLRQVHIQLMKTHLAKPEMGWTVRQIWNSDETRCVYIAAEERMPKRCFNNANTTKYSFFVDFEEAYICF